MIHILLARKPLDKKSIAENVIEHGTGGLNIDDSRIFRDKDDISGWHLTGADGSKGYCGEQNFKIRKITAQEIQERCGGKGRFPANIIFEHHPECKKIGTKKVKSDGHYSYKLPNSGGLYELGLNNLTDIGNPNADQDGKEEVENWECHPDCKVKILDEQSGATKKEIKAYKGKSNTGFLRGVSNLRNQHGDKGGASRFFKNF